MATGYDNRQGGRSSFAFEPAKPSQSQSAQASGFRGIQMDGGNTSVAGGIAAAAQFTEAGPSAGSLGGFFTELLAPAIEQRKKEQYVKGMVDQMSAVSGEEIRVNNKNPINQIFGPSAYEEGAIFYSAKDAVNQWQSKTLGDMDNLKRLPPDQLSKVIASSFEAMNTGDKFTDLAVNTALIEASQPVIGAIAKERYSWQQSEALNSKTKADFSAAEALQGAMVSLSKTSGPGDAENLAANAAKNNFLSALVQPAGMADETYRKSLVVLAKRAAQTGNGYAVSMLKNHPGFYNLLSDEEITKLEEAEIKFGNRAQGMAAREFIPQLLALKADSEFGRISPLEASAKVADINEAIKARTGFDQDLFDYKEITAAGGNVIDALHAGFLRQEARAQQVADMNQRHQWEVEDKEKEATDEAAGVQLAYGMGSVKQAMAKGIGSEGNYNVLAQADFAAGNWSNMVKAFTTDQWVSNLVKDQAQAQIVSSIGQEYSKDFGAGFAKFDALNKVRPAAAMAYYGDQYAPLLNFKRGLTAGLTPAMAFSKAFSDPAQYAATPKLTKTATDAITNWVKSNRGSTWGSSLGFGRKDLANGGPVLKKVLARQLGVMMQSTDVPAEKLIPGLYEQVKASGAYEDYGRLEWSNKPGTVPLSKYMGVMADEADEIIPSVIDKRLKAAGFAAGANGDNFDIHRVTSDGKPYLAVIPYDDDTGAGTQVLIPFSEFKQAGDKLRAGRVAKVSGGVAATGLDPYRRIKGESGAARIARINNELTARSRQTGEGMRYGEWQRK